mmetsp:Transcript_30615/g.51716  ORF Transcript_30615/g.51716 Transcript_30615/m.51716 type:complete len:478 (+) Transcript_30615:77-1510(+)
MGGAASSLSVEQRVLFTKEMDEVIQKHRASGIDDEALRKVIEGEYERILNAVKKPSVPKIGQKGGNIKKLHTNTRRRSFDTSRADKKKAASVQVQVQVSSSEATLPTATEIVDSWDSVTQQPFCDICRMAFKSLAFLDRHVQYSDLHRKNLSKKEMDNTPLQTAVVEEIQVPAKLELFSAQVEGKDYKLLYTGSKLFWRTQRNIDVDIYLHILPQVVEVISFDSIKHKETVRLYMSHSIIQSIIQSAVDQEFEEKKRELHSNDRFFSLPNEEEMKEKIFINKLITFVLQRLQEDSNCSAGTIKYVQLSGDSLHEASPLLDDCPLMVVPVKLTRRRRTNSQEIEAMIDSINQHKLEAGAHIDKAHALQNSGKDNFLNIQVAARISDHVYGAIQYFTAKRWYHKLSLPKQRFVKAVRRVIRRRLVLQTTKVLASKEHILRRKSSLTPKAGKQQSLTILPASPKNPQGIPRTQQFAAREV